ncbi:MAG: aminoglycoside phosphotransferase family protein [Anaerolineae bacterium]
MVLKKIIQQHFPHATLIDSSRPKGGISADITIVEILVNKQRQKVIIRQTATAENEFKLLTSLQATQIRSPKPLILDTSCNLVPTPYLILEHISGQPEYRFKEPARAGEMIGAELAAIHSAQLSAASHSFLPLHTVDLPTASDDLAERPLHDILESFWPLPSPKQPVLLHGDFWPGNLLWKDSTLTGVIDWEDARFGNPLQDLAISRFDTLFILGQSAFEGLTRTYFELNQFDYAQLARWDLYASLRAMPAIAQWAAGWPSLGRPDLTETAINQSLSWFIQQAMAKI